MIYQLSCRIVENRRIGKSCYYYVSMRSREISAKARPGQFVMLGLKNRNGLFLKRPYSICGCNGTFDDRRRDTFQILYKVVGKGTHALSSAKAGEEVSIIGPLGTPFSERLFRKRKAEHLIVAGGIGSAPFPFLINALRRSGNQPVMFYGGRSRDDLPLKDWFRKNCSHLFITTEDGSEGEKGLITELLAEYIFSKRKSTTSEETIIYACGPSGMLKKVAEISEEKGYAAFGSFEERMACGFGVCFGCAIRVRSKAGGSCYRHVCTDGPVFDMNEILYP
ncbi:MAG: dihydroorotate dehydrogenase electron transfer subunit [Acidobacteriota bacterium]